MTGKAATFRVVGNHTVDGHEPGATFTRPLGGRELFLIEAGHIELVPVDPKPGKEKEPSRKRSGSKG